MIVDMVGVPFNYIGIVTNILTFFPMRTLLLGISSFCHQVAARVPDISFNLNLGKALNISKARG